MENLALELEDVIPVLGQQQVTIIALNKEIARLKAELDEHRRMREAATE